MTPNPTEPDAPGIVGELIRQAEKAGASDIHLWREEAGLRVSFRLDGVMTPGTPIAGEAADRVFGRIKYLAKLKTYEDSMPQDGRIGRGDIGTAHDIRVATYPTISGEKIVLRLFTEAAAKPLEDLGLPEAARLELERCLRRPSGLILLTGPSGSGKTTTIYACLSHLSRLGGRHVITVEDPAERVIPGIMQTEISEARGLTFAVAARHLLRQDPQVLVIGEIRDEETAGIVVRAAMTGHLVISTLHAGSCQGVLDRLLVMCPDRYAAVSALSMVLNQRLVRRVCPGCAGRGCGACLETGYRGRMPVAEWRRVDEALAARLRQEGTPALQPEVALGESVAALVRAGLTTQAELERVLGN